MTDLVNMLLALVVGSLFALSYFGGLWWTVKQLPMAPYPSALYFGSLLLRLAMLMAGCFVVLVYCEWPQPAACLVGFVGTRLLALDLIRRGATPISPIGKGA